MHYKTIILEWIEARPEIHEPLRVSGQTLAVLQTQAQHLKNLHTDLEAILRRKSPEEDPISIRQAALEVAFQHWQEEFQQGASPNASEATTEDSPAQD